MKRWVIITYLITECVFSLWVENRANCAKRTQLILSISQFTILITSALADSSTVTSVSRSLLMHCPTLNSGYGAADKWMSIHLSTSKRLAHSPDSPSSFAKHPKHKAALVLSSSCRKLWWLPPRDLESTTLTKPKRFCFERIWFVWFIKV